MTDVTGEITYYAKQEGTVWTFTPAPDPRDARIAELEAQLAAYHDNPLKRIVMIDGAWIGQSFGDLDAQATEYQARIAELEAALRAIESEALRAAGTKWEKLAIIQDIAAYALMPPPERDMAITQEEVGA